MASNDYYTSFGTDNHSHQDTSYHGSGFQRLNAPLPSVPHSETSSQFDGSTLHHPQPHGPSPFQTPFDDDSTAYNQSSQSLDRPYQQDPFADTSAIPLRSHPKKPNDPPSPTSAMADAEQFGGYDRSKERASSRQSGWLKKKIPFAVYFLTVVQIVVFIAEIIRNGTLTGSPIEIHPQFNIMIGPSPYVLINMGARYVPCMRQYNVTGLGVSVADPSVNMPCPNTTTNDAHCTLADLCGFGLNLTPKNGVQPQPNQWFRFITPIFLHGGIIHISFNLLLQLTLGRDIEKQIGTLRFVLVYFSAGIFGFVLGGNYAPNGIMSSGCSGCLFGILALVLLDLLYNWRTRPKPIRELLFIMLDICVAFVLGLLPGLDNFSHIGGFLTGLVLGICILHSPNALRERIGLDDPPYASVGDPTSNSAVQSFVRKPVGFFKGRKPLWWAWWLIRAGALVAVLVAFIVLLRNFYVYRTACSWCKYLSCLPVKDWCSVGNLDFKQQPTKLKLLKRGELAMTSLL